LVEPWPVFGSGSGSNVRRRRKIRGVPLTSGASCGAHRSAGETPSEPSASSKCVRGCVRWSSSLPVKTGPLQA